MRIVFTVPPYNMRRYSRPWIAKVTAWPVGERPTLQFGAAFCATACEIMATSGELVRAGQTDSRASRGASDFYRVEPDASLTKLSDEEARNHFLRVLA